MHSFKGKKVLSGPLYLFPNEIKFWKCPFLVPYCKSNWEPLHCKSSIELTLLNIIRLTMFLILRQEFYIISIDKEQLKFCWKTMNQIFKKPAKLEWLVSYIALNSCAHTVNFGTQTAPSWIEVILSLYASRLSKPSFWAS